ncbi:hypothetical protein ABZ553_04800 [Streptomyces sparsogenes]
MADGTRQDALTDRVYEGVKAMIMDHEIAPGAHPDRVPLPGSRTASR